MTRKHTPEPWKLYRNDQSVGDAVGHAVCDVWPRGDDKIASEEGKANARRIVACVNACRGLPTDEMEKSGLASAFGNQMLELEQQRDHIHAKVDELLAALVNAKESLERCYDVTEWPCNGSTDQDKAIAIADAAIKKITGETK